jgi:hypothetical protein
MGFCIGTTTVQNIFKRTYRRILGQVRHLNYLTWIFGLVLAKQLCFGQSHPPIPPCLSLVAPFTRLAKAMQKGGLCYNRKNTSLAIMGLGMPRDIYGCGIGNWWCGGTRTWWHLSTFCITITCHAFNFRC